MQINIIGNETINQTIEIINQTIQETIRLEEQIQLKNIIINTTIIMLFITIIATIIYIRKNGKLKENTKKQEEIKKEILNAIYNIEHDQKVKEINISDLPHELRENLLEPKGFLHQIFFKGEGKYKHKPPYLLLIRSNMTAEMKHNAKEGEYIIEKKDQAKTKVRFILTRDKLIDVKIKGKDYRFWIQYEDEAEPYPVKPRHLASQFYNIVLALQMAKQGVGPKKGKFPKILIIIGIIGIIGGIAWYAYSKSKGIPTLEPTTIIQTVNQTINATLNGTTGIQAQTIVI